MLDAGREVKPTVTLAPAVMPELQVTSMEIAVVVGAKPTVCKHDPESKYSLVGMEPSAAEGVMVIVAPVARAAGVVNVTIQLVLEVATAVVGVTAAPVTAPVGVPMVYSAVVTDWAAAGKAVIAAKPPKAVMAKATALAKNLGLFRTRLGVTTEGFFCLILLCLPS